jgi:hypothetical protein
MIALPLGTKVFLACQPIDLRAGFDGLAAKVQQITNPSCGARRWRRCERRGAWDRRRS